MSEAIIGYLALRSESPSVASRAEVYDRMMRLLLLLDERGSEEAMGAVVKLASYNLGAHGGETLACVAVRKGAAILPVIDSLRSSDRSPCHAERGRQSPLCNSESDYFAFLRTVADGIRSGQPCELEP